MKASVKVLPDQGWVLLEMTHLKFPTIPCKSNQAVCVCWVRAPPRLGSSAVVGRTCSSSSKVLRGFPEHKGHVVLFRMGLSH